ELIHYPEFHNLFGEQVLSTREQMQVAAVTTLFTDITGSTEMYEKLGDIVAYNVVRDHFDILFTNLEKQGGTILKTIGDAVMASFTSNEAALIGIINALEEFERYNTNKHIDRQVNIKIGIHRGPTILVNLNERLDYFGSTINKAARIQAVANSGEICFSEQVYQDSIFIQTMKRLGVKNISRHSVNLKGINGLQTVYKAITKFNSVP
ncbi:MAG: adenylate/guanylate cyclase domain-containing protein, partial [Proteobacteria bacterium]|nr:adenylate/guanylate cyclase domain-containing protein [Pseudomonadota bacterium]